MEENELIKEENLIEESFNNFKNKLKDGYSKETHESLLLYINYLEKENRYKEIIDVIDENYKVIENDSFKLELLNKKITSLLRIEEFNELLSILDIKSTLTNLNIVEKTNILFYKSIAYEALDEIDLAIRSLESILDNISKYSLVNKYLKLALLYLKKNRIEEAKNAYDYASLIDPSHSNDMFILLESDLFYYSNKFNEALDSYMTFFLRSSNKYKYLDRYIKISIKLNRYEDAYNFYKEYINRSSIKFSSLNKYTFLKAVKELLLLMDKKDELNEILVSLEELKPTYNLKEENEKLKIIELITKNLSMPLTKYDKFKNVVNKFFKYIDSIKKDILVYVEKRDSMYYYSKYNSKELKEKEITYSSILENEALSFFEIKDDCLLDYYYTDKLERISSNVKVYRIKNEYKDYGFFFVSYDENNDDLYRILKNSLLEVLNRLDTLIISNNVKDALIGSINEINSGFISISSSKVEIFDKKGKEILNIKNDVLTFNEFRTLFIDDIYPDDFLKKELKLKLVNDDTTKIIKFNNSLNKDTIYSIISDYSIKEKVESEINDFYIHSNLKFFNENDLYKAIENESESYSLFGLTLNAVSMSDSINSRISILNNAYNFLEEIFKDSKLYYLNENHFLIYSNKIDKRLLDSYKEKLDESIHKMYKYSYSLRDNKVIGFYTKALKNKSVSTVKDMIEYGFFYSSIKNEFIALDSNEKRDYSLFKTYNQLIINAVNDGDFTLTYYPIIDELNNSIHYFLINYKFMYDINFSILERILLSNELETKLDLLLIEKAFKETNEFNNNIRYIIPIHKESVTNPNFIKKVSKLYKENETLDNRVIFKVEPKNIIGYKKGLESIKNIGINIGLNYKDISETSDFDLGRMIFVNLKEDNNFVKNIVYGIKDILKLEVVLVESNPMKGTLSLNSKFNYYTTDKMKKL